MIERPKHIVFDWDNTLVNSLSLMKKVMDKTLAILQSYGANVEISSNKEYWNLSLKELLHANSHNFIEKGKEIYYQFYKDYNLIDLRLFNGSIELIEFFKKNGVIVYIISNKEGILVRNEASHLGVSRYFKKIYGAGDSEFVKPSKEAVIYTLNTNISPQEVVLIGDSKIDVETAQSYNCPIILVNKEKQKNNYIKTINMKNLSEVLEYFQSRY